MWVLFWVLAFICVFAIKIALGDAKDMKVRARMMNEKERKAQTIVVSVGVAAGVIAVMIAIFMSASGPSSTDNSASSPSVSSASGDGEAIYACDHFRNIMGDVKNGLLTDAEFRDKIKQVNGNAQISTTPGIATDAQAMLADITQGDEPTFMSDATSFSDDCNNIGH